MSNKCKKHNWKKIYYRKLNKKTNIQDWKTIQNKFICDKCLIIRELKW